MRRHRGFGASAVLALVLIAPLAAHEHATGVIKQRMDAMKEMATAMKAIDRRVKGGRELAQVRADAERVQRLAETMTAAFPRGSGHHPSEAKPAVWKNWADFEDKARQLAAESGALARVDPQDAAAVTSQAKRVTQSCGGCHEIYRTKKQ